MKPFLIIFLYLICFSFFSSQTVSANTGYNFESSSGLSNTGEKITYKNLKKTLPQKIGAIIGAVLSFIGVAFLILMIYGGITWMTAAGNEEQIGKAKKIITAAIIGIVIVASAYAITSVVKGIF